MTISFDISTTCVGFALFSEEGKLMELSYVKFKDSLNMFEKLEEFKKATKILNGLPIKRIAIEEPLQRMQGKFSSAYTIAILNFFNGMISSYLYNTFQIEPIHYNVNNIRSTVFPGIQAGQKKEKGEIKHEVWKRVMALEPQINWKYGVRSRKLLPENYDMSDAFACGMCDLIMVSKQIKNINSNTME